MQTLTINVDDSYLDFLVLLENGPTISEEEADEWKKNINSGYKSWEIEEF